MDPKFEVDPEGLADVISRRGVGWLGHELISNSLDTDATVITVNVSPVAGRPLVRLTVEDDGPGFSDLRHAFTLFWPSTKKGDPGARGRFSVGEKLVMALCDEATVHTTTGTVSFSRDGRRTYPRRRRERGTSVQCVLRITHAQGRELLQEIERLLVPEQVTVIVNDRPLPYRPPLTQFAATLPTELAGADGRLTRTRRKTQVRVIQPAGKEAPTLFELGVPVVEAPAGCPWHVDVSQKVVLGIERDSVTPAYRRELEAALLSHTAHLLGAEHAAEAWVGAAIEHPQVSEDAVRHVVKLRYGAHAVVHDPSDREANGIAASRGFTVVPPRAFSKAGWQQIRRAGALAPAGQVTPSPKPFHPDGTPLRTLPEQNASPRAQQVATYFQRVGTLLLGRPVRVVLTDDRRWAFRAACGPDAKLVFSVVQQPDGFWTDPVQWDDLLIHELGHALPGGEDHTSASYMDNLTALGAKLVQVALDDPRVLRELRS